MTKAEYWNAGGEMGLVLDGHAQGSSEVCSAVSAIAYALAGMVTNAAAEGTAQALETELRSAHASIRFRGGAQEAGAWRMAVIGLKQIAETYPEYLQMEERTGL